MSEALEDQERFCASSWPRLVGAMTHYCGDVHVAEELVQEALLRACRRWLSVSTLVSQEGWIYHVAVNLANAPGVVDGPNGALVYGMDLPRRSSIASRSRISCVGPFGTS